MGKMTDEQQAVVDHPVGNHARVLAVAGSGKTSTMALRIRHLVTKLGVNPGTILVLMFNRMARDEFNEKLEKFGIPTSKRPAVHTFHSFAYTLISKMTREGLLPRSTIMWTGDKEEQYRINVHRAIQNLSARGEIGSDLPDAPIFSVDHDSAQAPRIEIDPGEAMEAIGLWKGSLIPPERAGYHGNEDIAKIYAEFEKLRVQQHALTYDDYVPLAVDMLTGGTLRDTYAGRYDHIIVDEYQDVNYGQQRMIELLAGKRADVMVVGDDDQTIYEWRGARPSYMIREFRTVFDNKPHIDYSLSHSFRFGPIVAQSAQNIIRCNTTRLQKPLVAHDMRKQTDIQIFLDTTEQPTDIYKALTDQVETLRSEQRVPAKQIIVLARMFAQLSGIEMEFAIRRIPYRVDGQKSFFERREILALLDYLRVAMALDGTPTAKTEEVVLSILNTPSRMIKRDAMRGAIALARMHKSPLISAFFSLSDDPDSTLNRKQRTSLAELVELLQELRERIDDPKRDAAGEILEWLVSELGYTKHFDHYYGLGEESTDRKIAVEALVKYALRTNLATREFLAHVAELDSTQGVPAEEQICMTTIFRTKGLEYDYVFIPACEEGVMPCLIGSGTSIYDKTGQVQEPEPSEAIENERRLFYVGITRAKRCVYIAASERQSAGNAKHRPLRSRFLEEIQLDSVNKVMFPLQQLHLQDAGCEHELIASLQQVGGVGWVKRDFIAQYLTRLEPKNEPLIGRAFSTIASARDVPFAYQQAYPTRSPSSKADDKEADADIPF